MEEIFNSIGILDATVSVWKLILRVVLAILFGSFIGIENRIRGKEAGIKTHTLLCFTACLLMIISKYGFYELAKFDGISYDASRIASNIISGLCFIGAGVVFYKQDSIKGLTSAVGICLTIAVGMCFGSGLIVVGAVSAVLTIILQIILHSKKRVFKIKKHILCRAKFVNSENFISHFKNLFEIEHFSKFKISKENDMNICEVEFTYKIKKSSEEIVEKVQNEKAILMFEKIEDR